jgi:hypothetical protein
MSFIQISNFVGFGILTTVIMKSIAFTDMISRNLVEDYLHIGGEIFLFGL